MKKLSQTILLAIAWPYAAASGQNAKYCQLAGMFIGVLHPHLYGKVNPPSVNLTALYVFNCLYFIFLLIVSPITVSPYWQEMIALALAATLISSAAQKFSLKSALYTRFINRFPQSRKIIYFTYIFFCLILFIVSYNDSITIPYPGCII